MPVTSLATLRWCRSWIMSIRASMSWILRPDKKRLSPCPVAGPRPVITAFARARGAKVTLMTTVSVLSSTSSSSSIWVANSWSWPFWASLPWFSSTMARNFQTLSSNLLSDPSLWVTLEKKKIFATLATSTLNSRTHQVKKLLKLSGHIGMTTTPTSNWVVRLVRFLKSWNSVSTLQNQPQAAKPSSRISIQATSWRATSLPNATYTISLWKLTISLRRILRNSAMEKQTASSLSSGAIYHKINVTTERLKNWAWKSGSTCWSRAAQMEVFL